MSTQNLGLYRANLACVGLSALAMLFTVLISNPALAQTIVATIPVGGGAVAVNAVTNKGYVADCKTEHGIGARPVAGTVAVIDGSTNTTTTITVGVCPTAMTVNPVTNKIYVANFGHISLTCGSCFNYGGITVIDGATNATSWVADPNARYPRAIAVNSATNKIYVANAGTSNVTVIDGDTNSVTTVSDPNAGGPTLAPYAVAVNQATNRIYVANNGLQWDSGNAGNVTVIDGATNSTTTITDPNAITPLAVAVNSSTNKIYVANQGNGYPGPNHGNITVIDGETSSSTTVADPSAVAPQAVVVDETTNRIYVANINDTSLSENGGVTVINGNTNSITTVRDPNAIAPVALAVDEVTNKIYVANEGSSPEFSGNNPGSVTVIDGVTGTTKTVIDPNAGGPSAIALDSITDTIYAAGSATTEIDGGANATSHIFSILLAGNGTGTVTSNPAGINCGKSCSASFATGTAVNLNAPAASGSFSELSGACTGTDACSLMMNQDNFVTATFSTSPPDFSLRPASASLSAQPGGPATDVITLAPLNGGSFGSAIQLSCVVTGPTLMPTCALSPSSVTPGANPAASTLTVTAPTTIAMQIPHGPGRTGSFYALSLPLMFGVTLVGRWKRWRFGPQVLGGLLVLLLFLQISCASGRNNLTTTPPPANYTVTVTAISGSIQHTAQVAVTVQ